MADGNVYNVYGETANGNVYNVYGETANGNVYNVYGETDFNGQAPVYDQVPEPSRRQRLIACLKEKWKVLLIVGTVGIVSTFALIGVLIASLHVSQNYEKLCQSEIDFRTNNKV